MNKSFFITTPIYYVNGDPHVGTAYTTIACDTLARYKKIMGYDVYFLTGTDEHGQKVEETAREKGRSPIEWCDIMVPRFKAMWKLLNIDYDDFIRTTEERHIKSVQKIMNLVWERGDIYLGEYEGKYCVSCETFVPENQIVNDDCCPSCGKKLRLIKEESYFFRMSKYQDRLLQYIDEHPDFILPRSKRNEVIQFVKQGLQDLSISRNTFTWGIPITFAPGHITYVWFDALVNYITAVGYENNPEMFQKYWTTGQHCNMVGKDIIRFHAIIWPCILFAAGEEPPTSVIAHGWWTSEGDKMSKSKGNVVDPYEETMIYGVDAFRYYMLREVQFGNDGDYSTDSIITRFNAELSNDLGNLLNRSLGMYHKYFDGVITESHTTEPIEDEIYGLWEECLKEYEENMDIAQFSKALESIWRFIGRLNKYIDETTPWVLAKDASKKERLAKVMNTLVNALYKIALAIYPFMPETGQKIRNQLGFTSDIKGDRIENIKGWELLSTGHKLGNPEPIFPRLDREAVKKLKKAKNFDPDLEIENAIDIEDFKKVSFRVVEILEAGPVEGSNKLLKFKVNFGDHVRQIVSGIAKYYPNPAELVGKKVLAVANLKVVKLKGELSQGMFLCTEDKKNGIRLIEAGSDIELDAFIS
ncbi:MAG: methionine--tRNA ligase [Fusobacteriaceae bacterium]|jgi:methionyl-tRNA synthetase|nr:methionine--tRNA ligase [Fusobacteriaceae bacterium]